MISSKEALEKIKERLFLKENDYVKTFIPCILKISQDLERLEELEKAQDLEIEKLGIIDGENVYQIAIRVLKVAFITLGKSDIANTCCFKYLEELEKENQELKKVIKKAIALLSVDGQGTKQEVKKILSEVLGE